jgi:hypothetical protein
MAHNQPVLLQIILGVMTVRLKTFCKKMIKAVVPYGFIFLWRYIKGRHVKALGKPVLIRYDDAPLPVLNEDISFVVVTSGRYPDRLMALLKQASSLADERVVILDSEDRSLYDTVRQAADTVIMLPGKGCFEGYSRDIFRYCGKTWILRLDDDETLSSTCTKDVLQSLIGDRTVSAYWIPRKWFINSESYITSNPWYPDYQLRLYRNQISFVELPPYIHSPLTVHGTTKTIDAFCLEHWDLVFNDRKAREKKVKYYDTLLPGNGCSAYYLYEDSKVETARAVSGKGPPLFGHWAGKALAKEFATQIRSHLPV